MTVETLMKPDIPDPALPEEEIMLPRMPEKEQLSNIIDQLKLSRFDNEVARNGIKNTAPEVIKSVISTEQIRLENSFDPYAKEMIQANILALKHVQERLESMKQQGGMRN